jgi:hypothetical protein
LRSSDVKSPLSQAAGESGIFSFFVKPDIPLRPQGKLP